MSISTLGVTQNIIPCSKFAPPSSRLARSREVGSLKFHFRSASESDIRKSFSATVVDQ